MRPQNLGVAAGAISPTRSLKHGAVMLASILSSPAAVAASIQVVRAFVRLRAILAAHKELARKIDALERKYDSQFKLVFETIREMLKPPIEPKRRIGFELPATKNRP